MELYSDIGVFKNSFGVGWMKEGSGKKENDGNTRIYEIITNTLGVTSVTNQGHKVSPLLLISLA